jgi:hypothetical protein
MPVMIGGRVQKMLLAVAHLELQQMRDVDHVHAVIKENCSMICTAIVLEVGMSTASFAFALNG